ncbi:MAG: response regulator [Candidatus Helarchaeota archaeon]|nr:response regulator [Candidatus Helarchaeota archaeon]
MKPLILCVDDNEDILLNLILTLEFNDYEVITGKHGKEGLTILSELGRLPDLIISDIMMPEMNGYDFFKTVSENAKWNRIPFLFLTARSSPTDVRFGKMLGVDDYLTKPFKKEDLIAIIAGKLTRRRRTIEVSEKVEEVLSSLKIDEKPSISIEQKYLVNLILVFWDDKSGPTVLNCYPQDIKLPFSVDRISVQLYNSIVSIYGQGKVAEAQGILLNIKNIDRDGYIYFDSYPDNTVRGGEQQYMLGVIAPKINYFESLKISEYFKNISSHIKLKEDWDFKRHWEQISNILSTPSL